MQQTNPNICINLFPLVSQLGNNFHLYALYIKMLSYCLQEKHFHFLYPLWTLLWRLPWHQNIMNLLNLHMMWTWLWLCDGADPVMWLLKGNKARSPTRQTDRNVTFLWHLDNTHETCGLTGTATKSPYLYCWCFQTSHPQSVQTSCQILTPHLSHTHFNNGVSVKIFIVPGSLAQLSNNNVLF